MPTDSQGNFSPLPSHYVEVGDKVLPEQYVPVVDDMAAAHTARLMRDGRAPMTGDLLMGDNRITGMADGIAPQDAATVAQLASAMPIGLPFFWPSQTPPPGAVKRNGALLSRTAYPELFAIIGTTFNTGGEPSDQFRLPDDRGLFERGWDDGAGIDTGRALGSVQQDQNKAHTHTGTAAAAGAHGHSATTNNTGAHEHNLQRFFGGTSSSNGPRPGDQTLNTQSQGWQNWANARAASNGNHSHTVTISSSGEHTHSLTINSDGGVEARVKNRAYLPCIKAF